MTLPTGSSHAPADAQGAFLDPAELFRIAWRRKWYFLVPAALFLGAAVLFLLTATPQYKSEATIFVEGQNVPEDIVPSLMPDYIDRRLDMLTRRVLLTSSLSQLVKQYDLYPVARENMPSTAIVERVRNNIQVVLLNTEVTNPQSGRTGETTVAFKVGFTYKDPETARRVTNELVSLFLSSNLEARRDVAEQTTSFLAKERAAIEDRIAQLEDEFTEFQTENRELLPEEVAFSRQQLANIETQLDTLDRDLRALREREGFLTTQLALMNEFESTVGEGGATTPESQLERLRAELASAEARYGSNHPDLVRLQREVRSLERVVGERSGGTALLDREAALSAELARLRERYTEDHPDVVSVERQLANVRDTLANAEPRSGGPGVARNPAFIQLKAQLNSVQTELNSVAQQREELIAKRDELQQRLARAPAVEREFTRLSRELENAIADREIIADKEATAGLSRALETEAVGERLVLAEPPTQPLSPVSPNKKMILAIGLVLAMGGGGASVLLAEMLDRSVHSIGDLAAIIGEKPLVSIPVLRTTRDTRRLWSQRAAALMVVVAVAAGAVFWIDHAVVSLEVLSFELQNRFDQWWTSTFAVGSTG